MSEPFLGEIRMVSFAFAPHGWALCNGQLLAINLNQALFALLGTTFGGNGQTTFALPDFRERIPVSFGQGAGLSEFVLGQAGGETAHTLTPEEWVSHSHALQGTRANAETAAPSGAALAITRGASPYGSGSPAANMHAETLSDANPSPQAHENRQPFLTVNFVIALQGIFPARP